MSSGISMPPPSKTEQNLTDSQKMLISDTLSQFDTENLTEADALSIVETLSEAGIEPGAGLGNIMSELGFDAKNIGDLASASEEGSRPPPPPPPKQSSEEITSMVDFLAELMEEKLAASNSTELSSEDKESILAQVFEKFDIEDGDSIINTSA